MVPVSQRSALIFSRRWYLSTHEPGQSSVPESVELVLQTHKYASRQRLLRSRHWWLTMSEHCTGLCCSNSSPYTLRHRQSGRLDQHYCKENLVQMNPPELLDDLVVQQTRLLDHLAHQLVLLQPAAIQRHLHAHSQRQGPSQPLARAR